MGGGVSATGMCGRCRANLRAGKSPSMRFGIVDGAKTVVAIIEQPWQCSNATDVFFEVSGPSSCEPRSATALVVGVGPLKCCTPWAKLTKMKASAQTTAIARRSAGAAIHSLGRRSARTIIGAVPRRTILHRGTRTPMDAYLDIERGGGGQGPQFHKSTFHSSISGRES